jgi:hypothetical protein
MGLGDPARFERAQLKHSVGWAGAAPQRRNWPDSWPTRSAVVAAAALDRIGSAAASSAMISALKTLVLSLSGRQS